MPGNLFATAHYMHIPREVATPDGEHVDLMGWIKSRRDHGCLTFIDVTDSTGAIQVVVAKSSLGEEVYTTVKAVSVESAVHITGSMKTKANGQREIMANRFSVISVDALGLQPGTKVTKSFDLLWKGLEITTGAQREHRVEQLMKQAEEKGYSLEPLKHYFEFFRHGCPPHGGFGVGLTRLLMCITGLSNVREVTFLYRGINRLTP